MKSHSFTTFWHGGELTPISYTSIKSFIDLGHRIQLFSYGNVSNAPNGAILRNAEDILPISDLADFEGRFANFSDLFRYEFLYKEGGFWIDADVICIREEVPSMPIYFAYEKFDDSSIGTGALALPKDNVLAKLLANYAYDPGLIPPWEEDDTNHRLWLSHSFHSLRERRQNTGNYNFLGPALFTSAVKHYNYVKFAQPYTDLCPIGWGSWRNLFFDSNLAFGNENFINSWAVHCWGNMCTGECNDILENGKGMISEMIRKNWKEIS